MLSFKLLPHSFVIPEEEDEETGNETANGERQRFTLTLTQIAGLMIQVLRLLLVVLLLMLAVFPFLLPFSHLMKFQPMDHVCVCACLFFYFRFHELFRSSDPPPPKSVTTIPRNMLLLLRLIAKVMCLHIVLLPDGCYSSDAFHCTDPHASPALTRVKSCVCTYREIGCSLRFCFKSCLSIKHDSTYLLMRQRR
jgi:hypothetical protein